MYPCSLSLMIALLIGPLRGEPTKKEDLERNIQHFFIAAKSQKNHLSSSCCIGKNVDFMTAGL